ncbi:MAG: 16S rRNA pseudouridine(516) synthase RsuA [Gammaproteobacteria bacterium]|nr:MAG: 16S rRNA pseudouridine(516) synthase RsuA [Gammaproteobacteria bacterium]
MRLDKFISDTTPLSRSEAKKAIKAGRLQVNGKAVSSASHPIGSHDIVLLDNARLQLMGHRYFMLNKPAGYLCATRDADHPTVISLLQEPLAHKLHIAGRLDKDTTGMLLISDDGQWSHRATSPRYQCQKRYRVQLATGITSEAVQQLEQGILLKGETKVTRPATVNVVKETEILLTISEGKYHQVKRMLAAVGNHVTALHREQVGSVELDTTLLPGEYRPLTSTEINCF